MIKDKCSNCGSEKLLFLALCDANCNFSDWYDDGRDDEAFCEDCRDWVPLQKPE